MNVFPGNYHQMEQEKRLEHFRNEEITVNDLGNGAFEAVNHSHHPQTRYLVRVKKTPTGSLWALNCECPDFLSFCNKHFMKCKHMIAVEMSQNEKKTDKGVYSLTERLLEKLTESCNLPQLIQEISNGTPETIKSIRETTISLSLEMEKLNDKFDEYSTQLEEAACLNGRNELDRKKKFRSFMSECIEIQELKENINQIREEVAVNDAHCEFLNSSLNQKCALAILMGGIISAQTLKNQERGVKNEKTGRIMCN